MTQETISRLVKASGVQPGELVLVHFWGEDDQLKIARCFMIAVAQLGASPLLWQQSRSLNSRLFAQAAEESFDEKFFSLLAPVDAVLDVFAYQPVVLGKPLEREAMERYRRFIRRLFGELMKKKRFAQIRIPTQENAEESGLEPEDFIRRMENAYDVDYEKLRERCVCEASRWKKQSNVVLCTGEGCELHFTLAGRQWHADAGDGDLPCGEIYIAPIEEQTNGSVYYETFYLEGEKYPRVTLWIQNGEIVDATHEAVRTFFAAQPKENRIVCELGLGMNPNVQDLCGCAVLDEKMMGTFHIAAGANHLFGGANEASCHRDFVGWGELRPDV